MPAPKRPNTAAATAAVIRKAQERKAAELRAAGWTVEPPDGELREHRPVIDQDPATNRYHWRCWCGETWMEPVDADPNDDPILTAEATARDHWRCRDCGLPVVDGGGRRDTRHDHCGRLPHTGPVGSYCEKCG